MPLRSIPTLAVLLPVVPQLLRHPPQKPPPPLPRWLAPSAQPHSPHLQRLPRRRRQRRLEALPILRLPRLRAKLWLLLLRTSPVHRRVSAAGGAAICCKPSLLLHSRDPSRPMQTSSATRVGKALVVPPSLEDQPHCQCRNIRQVLPHHAHGDRRRVRLGKVWRWGGQHNKGLREPREWGCWSADWNAPTLVPCYKRRPMRASSSTKLSQASQSGGVCG